MKGMEFYIKSSIICALVVICCFFGYRYFAVSGNMQVTYDFSTDEHPVVEHFSPKGRAKEPEKNVVTGNTYQRIVGDPVYMNLTVPRSFETVDVIVNYKNPDKQFAQFGVILSEEPYAVRLAPFEVPIIDEAEREWRGVTNDSGVTLLQREDSYESYESFIEDIPQDAAIGTYLSELPVIYSEEEYTPAATRQTINHSLRGTHTFVTYIENEDMDIRFQLQDENAIEGADQVVMRITNADGTVVYEDRVEDDGITDDSRSVTDLQSLHAVVSELEAGVYTVRVSTTEDILITQVDTAQKRLVLKDLLLLDDADTEALSVYSEAQDMRLVSSTLDGLQDVVIKSADDETTVGVGEVHTPYTWIDDQVGGHIRTFDLEENNIRLWTRGYFAFTETAYFDPDYRVQPITEFTELADLDYIVYNNYTSPDHKRLESTQHVQLSFDGMAGDRKELQFVLSMPGIDEAGAEVTINDVSFTFNREPFLTRVKNRLWGNK